MSSVSILPPRPSAIATLFKTEKGAIVPSTNHIQTLVYSIHKSLQHFHSAKFRKENPSYYPPEILILVSATDNDEDGIIRSIRKTLSVFSIRIVRVQPIYAFSAGSSSSEDHNEVSELHLFNQQCYKSILFIKQDCLVTEDISQLFDRINENSKGIIVASHDEDPKTFKSTFMLINPSSSLFNDMFKSVKQDFKTEEKEDVQRNYGSVCDQFLNFYYQSKAKQNELSFPAKLIMESEMLEEKLDLDTVNIFNFFFSPKPWESEKISKDHSGAVNLWYQYHKDSQSYIERRKQKQKEILSQKKESEARTVKQKQPRPSPSASKAKNISGNDSYKTHNSIAAKYKQLRKQGLSAKEAMIQSRIESGGTEVEADPGASVAAMFGLS